MAWKSLLFTWLDLHHPLPQPFFTIVNVFRLQVYFSLCLSHSESVCTGRWRGQRSAEERVQGSRHAAGSPHWPPHPTHAQHHPGEGVTWSNRQYWALLLLSLLNTLPLMTGSSCFFTSTCCSAPRTQMRTWLWRPVSSGWLWLNSPSAKRPSLATWSSKCLCYENLALV